MLISQHLTPEAISLNLHGETMEEILAELSGLVAAPHRDLNRDSIHEELIQRERLLSTASGGGLAIPHCYCRVDSPRFAIGISRRGIEAEAPDDKPVHIFLVVISPERNPSAHLEALSAASRVFQKGAVRERILAAGSPEEVFETIRDAEADSHA
jgi:mannitol/fructose-specific phosphotransferase system IIA component (Ntr-type)